MYYGLWAMAILVIGVIKTYKNIAPIAVSHKALYYLSPKA